LKTFFLATAVLSLVLGLGLMLAPLRKFSIDPARVPELLLCTMPLTVTMVIPIAALLATTLIYGRLAYSNEINACRSSGIGLMTLVYPALTLALLVGMATLLLGFHVIPDFIAHTESIIKSDAEAMIYRNIEKKGNLGNLLPVVIIHADYVDPEKHLLRGVVLVQREKDDNSQKMITREIMTAQSVRIKLNRKENQPDQLLLELNNARWVTGDNEFGDLKQLPFSVPLPSLFQDAIQFKKLHELQIIKMDMARFQPIREQLEIIQEQLTVENFFTQCDRQLKQNGFIDLITSSENQQHRLRIKAGNCKDLYKNQSAYLGSSPGRNIQIDYFYLPTNQEPEKQFQAETAKLQVETNSKIPFLNIILKKVTISYADDPRNQPRHESYALTQVLLPDETIKRNQSLSEIQQAIQNDSTGKLSITKPSPYLAKLYENVRKRCLNLTAKIKAELHSRLAFGVSCVVLTMLGAALGILFRSGHLLTAFGVSFVPAAMCLTTIFTGQHITEDGSVAAGLAFLWSGIVVVALINIVLYKKLMKT
jgi:lipopolysaccharide export LptBFGC system permease protein LptF